MTSLADALEAHGPMLGARAIAEMYEDPFWDARFGARGRKFAEEDGLHHVRYLVESLRSDQPSIMVGYVRWLQGVLIPRGMCSRHIAENLRRLSRVVVVHGPPEAERAVDLLNQAAEVTRYKDGPAAEIDAAGEALVGQVTEALAAASPGGCGSEAGEPPSRSELETHLSYLADAVHRGAPETFLAHVRFWSGFQTSQGRVPGALARMLVALASAPAMPATARPLVERALAEVRAGVEGSS